MKTAICYFSGTGNSYYVAKEISKKLRNCSLFNLSTISNPEVLDSYTEIGFICPTYFYGIPNKLQEFIAKIKNFGYKYYFLILTYGGSSGNAIAAARDCFFKNGLKLSYGAKILMPDNYIVMFNLASDEKINTILENAKEQINKCAYDISLLKFNMIVRRLNILDFVHNFFAAGFKYRDKKFRVSNHCTGCGICEKICNSANITMEGGKPVFHNNCEYCLSCLSWCPQNAINYKSKTNNRLRYRNPFVSIDELIANSIINKNPNADDDIDNIEIDENEENFENIAEGLENYIYIPD